MAQPRVRSTYLKSKHGLATDFRHCTTGQHSRQLPWLYGQFWKEHRSGGDTLAVGRCPEQWNRPLGRNLSQECWSWTATQILHRSVIGGNANQTNEFGHSLAINNGLLAIGSPRELSFGQQRGAIHFYTLNNNSWTFLSHLQSSALPEAERFGTAFALTASDLFVGAPDRDITVASTLVADAGA